MLRFLLRWWYARRCCHEPVRDYLQAALPGRRTPLSEVEFLAVDLETTGLDPWRDEIVSVAWVPVMAGAARLAQARHILLRVNRSVGQSAVFHAISDEDSAAGGSFRPAMEAFLAAARGRVLVFHHAELDAGFLSRAMRALWGVPLLSPVIDTLALERAKLLAQGVIIGPGDLRLFACRQRYGLPDYPAHDALTDALATAELLLAQAAFRGSKPRLADLS